MPDTVTRTAATRAAATASPVATAARLSVRGLSHLLSAAPGLSPARKPGAWGRFTTRDVVRIALAARLLRFGFAPVTIERVLSKELPHPVAYLSRNADGCGPDIIIGDDPAALTHGAVLRLDHDPATVLARTGAGNLRLATDSRGLHFEATLPDTTAARDTWALVESRTAGGMSFGFRVAEDRWSASDLRELLAVDLIEISVVSAFPAYSGTDVAARARPLPGLTSPAALRRLMECI